MFGKCALYRDQRGRVWGGGTYRCDDDGYGDVATAFGRDIIFSCFKFSCLLFFFGHFENFWDFVFCLSFVFLFRFGWPPFWTRLLFSDRQALGGVGTTMVLGG